jgi:hypothetical protein
MDKLKTWAEIHVGIVRYVFEAPTAPYGHAGIYYHDVTDYYPKPEILDEFDPAARTFKKPESQDPNHPKNLQIAWNGVRNIRNTALNLSDYTQLLDFPDKVMQKRYGKYRQELRDLPEKYDSPYDVQFPIEPYRTEIKLTICERLQYVWSYIKSGKNIRSR